MARPTISEPHTNISQINSSKNLCLHCDVPCPSGSSFCCMGCETAYAVRGISDEKRKLYSPLASYDTEKNAYSLTLLVHGVHCASCIQLIEKTLLQEENVIDARINMSTGRLSFSWTGKAEQAERLAYKIENLGYKLTLMTKGTKEKDDYEKSLLYALAVSGFGMGNLMIISVALWSSSSETMGGFTRDLFHWISMVISLPVIIFSARPFLSSAWSVLKNRRTNMDVPISLGIILATVMSIVQTINRQEHIYFDSAVMLIFFLLIGRYFDAKARGKAKQNAQDLLNQLRGYATIIEEDNKVKHIPIEDITQNMVVSVAIGENIPADGHILEGETEIDTSLITGETIPVYATKGAEVFAGTLNLLKPILIKVSRKSEKTLLSQIVKLMEQAEQGQSYYVQIADRVARLYTPFVHIMGALAFIIWWGFLGMAWQPALMIAITVLIITCPCALALAVPIVQIIASGILMKKGTLLKSADALERLSEIDIAIFDKTGSLTLGKPILIKEDISEDIIRKALSLAVYSKHPLSKALLEAYPARELLKIEDFSEIAGKGLIGKINGETIKLGNRNWCDVEAESQNNRLELWLKISDSPTLPFYFNDDLRENAQQVIAQLEVKGIKSILLSGDRKIVVEETAKQVGIKEYYGEMTPEDKFKILESLKAKGHKILMVGDGLNDAPSLAAAHISMSPSTAVDIAQNTADIVFQSQSLSSVVEGYNISVRTQKLVKSNLILSIGYNIFAVPLAFMGYVTPLVASLAMSSSSLLVIFNSFRLYRKDK